MIFETGTFRLALLICKSVPISPYLIETHQYEYQNKGCLAANYVQYLQLRRKPNTNSPRFGRYIKDAEVSYDVWLKDDGSKNGGPHTENVNT